jgi:hypothetical protein
LINNFLISINTIRKDWEKEFAQNTLSEKKKYKVYFQFLLEIMKTKYPDVYDRFYFKDSGFLIQPRTFHHELYNLCSTGTVQGQKHILDNCVQEFSKIKLNELLDAIFGRNILSDRLAQLSVYAWKNLQTKTVSSATPHTTINISAKIQNPQKS